MGNRLRRAVLGGATSCKVVQHSVMGLTKPLATPNSGVSEPGETDLSIIPSPIDCEDEIDQS